MIWRIITLLVLTLSLAVSDLQRVRASENPIPLLAYYYIWFDQSSWDRAKVDYPILGRYSSDDRQVMQQHVRWAKDVGIDGFIVSWKSTGRLNRRLDQLVELAGEEDFKLLIIYQGLDFERDPLPVDRIADDLAFFADRYSSEGVFDLYGRPLVIWSGTWAFSEEEVASVTSDLRDRLLILASERNVEGYQRLAPFVDGDAYYWSSVNPDTYPNYQGKLDAMSEAIHAHNGLWIAPAAPGFDARLVGGTRVVERKEGATLLRQMQVAMNSSPDGVGVISWNEFSENSHIEPSENYGMRYLEVLADFTEGTLPSFEQFASDEPLEVGEPPVQRAPGPSSGSISAVMVVFALALLSLALIAVRRSPQNAK